MEIGINTPTWVVASILTTLVLATAAFRLYELWRYIKVKLTAAKTSIPSTRTEKRIKVEEIEFCPHCDKEIGEKELYRDPEENWFHRPCLDKGPIQVQF